MVSATGKGEVLPREFYLRDAREVARDLLGKELVRKGQEGSTSGLIVETEAYLGVIDRASHAFNGKTSRRTAIMYEEGGHSYVYFIYGMYWCMNVTVGEVGTPEAVLIRALEPIEGIELMRQRRHAASGGSLISLTNGPGKLCQALAIDGSLYGEDLCGDLIYIRNRMPAPATEIVMSPRVNIDYAGEAKFHEWRFFMAGNPFVSRTQQTDRSLRNHHT